MGRAASLLRDHLAVFTAEGELETPSVQITSVEDQELLDKLYRSVNELELSVRAVNCLNTAQIRLIGQLVEKEESEMLKYRNFGKKSLMEIKSKLAELGLSLGMGLRDEIKHALDQGLAEQQQED